jgi:valyl-tRNA synthetase
VPNVNAVLAGSRLKVKHLRQPFVHGIDLGMAEGRLHLWQQSFAHDQHAYTRIVQYVFILVRLEQGVDRNRHSANLDPAEEAVRKLRRIQQQQSHAFFLAHAEVATVKKTGGKAKKAAAGKARRARAAMVSPREASRARRKRAPRS